MKFNRATFAAVALTLFVVALRVLPYLMIASKNTDSTPGNYFYPWNFSPLWAACLLLGGMFGNRPATYLWTMVLLVLSDAATGWAMGNVGFFLHSLIPFTYGCFLFSSWLGTFLERKRTVVRAGATALVSAIVFFFVTNAGNWWLMPTHPHTFAGLLETYRDGIPFFRHQLIGTAMYGLLFYGLAVIAEKFSVADAPKLGTSE